MKIIKIRIENFRSIQNTHWYLELKSFNVFVGQNNHGKTNLFEAIDWFFNGFEKSSSPEDICYRGSGSWAVSDIFVEIAFSGLQEEICILKNEKHQTALRNIFWGIDEINIRRVWNATSKKEVQELQKPDWSWENTLGAPGGWSGLLPNFEYIHTRKYYDEVSKYASKSPVGKMLSAVLGTILSEDQRYQDFQKNFNELFWEDQSAIKHEFDSLGNKIQSYLKQHFPDCVKVGFKVVQPEFEDLLKNFDTTIDDGVETKASEKGDGMQRALMLSIIQAYADFRREKDTVGKNFLFFIDEAEVHLHPTAQRNLKEALLSLSEKWDQVFITTHSSVLIANEHERQAIFRVEKKLGATEILGLKHGQKADVIYELLGGSPADLLLPTNFLIVEGLSDFIFFRHVISNFYSDPRAKGIQVIFAEGDHVQQERSMNAINKLFTPLSLSIYKDKAVILCDKSQKPSDFEDFKNAYPHLEEQGLIFQLPTKSIEEYYPTRWRKTEEEVRNLGQWAKTTLANDVGLGITEAEFVAMDIAKQALDKALERSFSV